MYHSNDKHRLLYKFLIKFISPLILNIFVKKIKNYENLERERAFIIASNHASLLDSPIVASIFAIKFKRKIHFIGKEETFRNFFGRLIQETAGTIKLENDKGKLALKIAENYLKKGKIIGIFPEGERSYNGRLLKAKTGVARLAISSKVPVLPIAIKGTQKLMPRGHTFPKFRKEVTVNIGKFLYFDKHGKKPSKKFYREITNKIMKNIETLMKIKS